MIVRYKFFNNRLLEFQYTFLCWFKWIILTLKNITSGKSISIPFPRFQNLANFDYKNKFESIFVLISRTVEWQFQYFWIFLAAVMYWVQLPGYFPSLRLQEQIREYFRLDIKNGENTISIFLNFSGCSYVLSTTTWIFPFTLITRTNSRVFSSWYQERWKGNFNIFKFFWL